MGRYKSILSFFYSVQWYVMAISVMVTVWFRIESLLEKTVSVFNSKCRSRFHRPPPLTPLRGNMPCTDILTACVDYILNTVSPVLQIMHKPIGDVDIQETDLPAGKCTSYISCLNKWFENVMLDFALNLAAIFKLTLSHRGAFDIW